MTKLENAIALRNDGKGEDALVLIKALLSDGPEDPILNFQMAWTCDYLGKESEAAPYYEKAIAGGLTGEDLRGAFLGLGSTYRCLGRYEESIKVFDKAIVVLPDDRALQAFRALTLYNLGRYSESVELLLSQLIETTADENIKKYASAFRFYADKLDQTWE